MNKKAIVTIITLSLLGVASPFAGEKPSPNKALTNNLKEFGMIPKPTKQQLAFQDMELGAFYHFGMSTFTGEEHGLGRGSPAIFNPKELDARQWVSAAKAMGARYAVLTARHEDGFCLWPTETTDYCVRNSPWKDGKGDVVGEFVAACSEAGIKPGLYFSPMFNAHDLFKSGGNTKWGSWGVSHMSEEELAVFKAREIAQARELITRYKPFYIWCDHNLGDRSDVLSADVTKAMIEADPNLIILGPHIWVTGNEAGHVTYPLWNAVNTKDDTLFTRPRGTEKNPGAAEAFGMLETDVYTGHPFGKFWRPIEAVTDKPFGRGRWFWRAGTTHGNSGEKIVDSFYHSSVGLGANLMINFAPDQRGLVPDDQVKGAAGFAKALKERFSNLIAETKGVTTGDTVELSWDQPQEIHYVVLMENIANGQKIAAYTLEAWVDGQWQVLKSRNPAGFNKKSPAGYETIGHKKIDRLVPVTTNKVRFRCLNAVTQPVEIRSMAVYGN